MVVLPRGDYRLDLSRPVTGPSRRHMTFGWGVKGHAFLCQAGHEPKISESDVTCQMYLTITCTVSRVTSRFVFFFLLNVINKTRLFLQVAAKIVLTVAGKLSRHQIWVPRPCDASDVLFRLGPCLRVLSSVVYQARASTSESEMSVAYPPNITIQD